MLSEILNQKRKFIENLKRQVPQDRLIQRIKGLPKPLSFSRSLNKGKEMHLICEVKKASPSAGLLRESFDAVKIAKVYQANGADAISVLTDEPFFQGSLTHLIEVKRNVTLPVLRKDFILDAYQIYEARAAGTDAVLLIASLFTEKELSVFLSLARDLQVESLIEVHTADDLKKALAINASLIGINQRDLHTFEIDRSVAEKLMPMIPQGKTIVCESGIKKREEIQYLKDLGIHVVLIGETFMRSPDISAKIKELMS